MSIGSLLIIFSLIVSLVSLIFLARSAGGNRFARITSQRLFYLSGISIAFAVILLFAAFLSNSFQYTYVFNYSSNELSNFYLIAGFWAGQEGTFLLWVFLLYIFGFVIIRSDDEYENIVLSVITITQIFLLVILCVPSFSPFRYIWDSYPGHFKQGIIPENGSGLNPLLQNPWMIAHPPVLFIGYASATIPFAYAISGLLKNDFTSWVNRSYWWVLFCTVSLGIGIFLGAYWAYTVLGWGGYWGWDPVENSSLIPWIVVVALMHGLIIQMRKKVLIKTNIFLSLAFFILVFYSTFLTRSGVLSDFSVHSFSDLGLSGPLIFFISFFIVISAFLYIKGIKEMGSKSLGDKIFTADNLMSFGIIVLCFYAFFILIGTSMPILSKVFLPKPTTVKETFYNNLSIPFGISLLVLIPLSTMLLSSKKIDIRSKIVISIVSIVFGVLFNVLHTKNIFAYVFIILALFVSIQSIADLIRYRTTAVLSSRLAHIGVALLVIGIITSNLHSSSVQRQLTQDREEKIERISLIFKGISESQKPSLRYTLKSDNAVTDIETPYFIDKKTRSLFKEPYIQYGFFSDVYISPVEYRSGVDNASKILLSKGITKINNGLEFEFKGFNTNKMDMMKGNGIISTEVRLGIKGKRYTVLPGVVIKGGRAVRNIDTTIPGTKRRVSLLRLDVAAQEVLLYIEPSKREVTPPDSVIVEVSFKRLIWFVWLGTIFISAGLFVAIRRRWRQAKN
jgi:cytochrome c-type biogenesis protein CcmF